MSSLKTGDEHLNCMNGGKRALQTEETNTIITQYVYKFFSKDLF